MAANVTPSRTFRVGSDSLWLMSGGVHYFRLPAGVWRDRLQKAAWAGLNCIETPVPWNFHEVKPGKFEFRKDADIEGFLRIVRELDLHAIVRVGPYIGVGWDFGGLPADLANDPSVATREADPVYLERAAAWFAELLPRIAALQATRGGPVIAVALEHDYFFPDRPRGEAYLHWLVKQARAHGLDVPLLGATGGHYRVKGLLETWTDGDDAPTGLARLAEIQPNQPRLVLNLPTGSVDRWGVERRGLKSPADCVAQVLRIVAEGGHWNWSPFAAGSNAGFWAGRSPRDDVGFLTTTYDCDAPVTEGGGLTVKYHALRTVHLMVRSLSKFLAASEPTRLKSELPSGFVALARRTPSGATAGLSSQGGMLFVLREEGNPDRWADVSLAGGLMLPLDFSAAGGLALPLDWQLNRKLRIDYSNCSLLATWLDRFVLLHAPEGGPAVVSINGTRHEFTVPRAPNLEWREAGDGNFVVVMGTATAHATWIDPVQGVIIGADRPSDRPQRSMEALSAEGIVHIGRDGNMVHQPARTGSPPRPPRRIGNWRRLSDVPEIVGAGDGWKRISGPTETAALGVPRGYVWYRIRLASDRKRTVSLFLPGAEDRAHLWLDGRSLGVWGRAGGASRELPALDIDEGSHTLVVLTDNLGHFSRRVPMTDRKGLYEHIYHANVLHLSEPLRRSPPELPPGLKAAWTRDRVVPVDRERMSQVDMHFSQPQGTHLHLECRRLPDPCWIYINDQPVGFFHGRHQAGFLSMVLPAPRQSLNWLRLFFPQRHERSLAGVFRICDLAENLTDGRSDWAFKPWTPPDPTADRWSRELKDPQKLRWYSAQFPEIKGEEAVFLNLSTLGKGQVLLNGRNLGRFWSVGPQSRLLIPESALSVKGTNELLIFEEEGRSPVELQLEFDPLGPFGDPHTAELAEAVDPKAVGKAANSKPALSRNGKPTTSQKPPAPRRKTDKDKSRSFG